MSPQEHAFLLDLIRRERFCGKHLEIGTAAGGTLWRMLACFDDQERPAFVVVDRMKYFPNQLSTVRANLEAHSLDPKSVDFRMQSSKTAFRESVLRAERFDFILVDASHKVMAVTADLRWSRLLNVNGILCLHDYGSHLPGVRISVDRFLEQHKNYEVLGLAESLIALRKIRRSNNPEVGVLDWAYAVVWTLPLEARRKFDKYQNQLRRAKASVLK